jgi:hypothetical protein
MATPQASSRHSKLYVSNLSQAATLAGMRELFGTCGDVLEIEFAAERNARSFPSAAYITMATSAAADRAVEGLHGRLYADRVLVVSRCSEEPAPAIDVGGQSGRRSTAVSKAVVMTQQYRDRHGLTYELSCSEKRLTLRFLFPGDDGQDWQIEANLLPGAPSPVTASGATRARAFEALASTWGTAEQGQASELDWEAIATAMRAVRAL